MLSQTLILIIITVVISATSFNNPKVYGDFILYPPAINRGQYYRFLTSGFIHANWQHLLFNMITLYFFGEAIEAVLVTYVGKWAFLALYLGGIIISDIPSYLKNKHNSGYASLGASGGVSSVVFAFIIFAPWSWFAFPPVPAILYGVAYMWYSVYMSKRGGDHINHDAHLWGSIFGVVFIFINMPEQLPGFLERLLDVKGPRF
jgi:membrane associated rhomboid family serine protease